MATDMTAEQAETMRAGPSTSKGDGTVATEKKWELVEDSFTTRRQRYVEYPSGRILGRTSGRPGAIAEWYALTETTHGVHLLGIFVTEDLAKKAVEAACDDN